MAINIYENPIQPIIDLDSDVIVYVPGYANYGPSDPTFVTSATFTSVFGSTPYVFKGSQVSGITTKNNRQATQSEKSWLYAKALTDAGLTVLYNRYFPDRAPTAKKENGAFAIRNSGGNIGKTFNARAKYFGSAYDGMYITFTHRGLGIVVVSIYNVEDGTKIEERIVSFNPNKNNYIGNIEFTNIVFYTGNYGETTCLEGFESLNLESYYSDNPTAILYSESNATLEGAFENIYIYAPSETGTHVGVEVDGEMLYTEIIFSGVGRNTHTKAGEVYTLAEDGTWVKYGDGKYVEITTTGDEANTYALESIIYDEFLVTDLETELASSSGMVAAVLDTNKYATVTYLTTGGYFQNDLIAGNMMNIAGEIKALAPIDLDGSIATVGDVTALQTTILERISTNSDLDKSFGYMDIGADTYVPNGIRTILPDSFGGLMALAGNIRRGIPAWLPVANNTQGIISSAVATTRPVGRTSQEAMITEAGCSINPIVQKQNVGFVLMGNRTLYPNDGVLGPQSFKNCRFVVNSVERAARRVADSLLIASTNATSTFRKFVSGVETTLKKMLVNGDGINSYSIIKLPKTKPATIDVLINLVVVEGIETFNIHIPYSINMQA
jgi:hypothetical protein